MHVIIALGETPLHWTAICGHRDAAARLLQRGKQYTLFLICIYNRDEHTLSIYTCNDKRLHIQLHPCALYLQTSV